LILALVFEDRSILKQKANEELIMSDFQFDKTLPLSAIRYLTEENLMAEGLDVSKIIYRLSKAPLDKVLDDVKLLSKLVIENESTGEIIEYNNDFLTKLKEEEFKKLLEQLSFGQVPLQDYLLDYFHQGGFQNYAEVLVSKFFFNQFRLLTKTGSRTAHFTIKADGRLHFRESYEISAIKEWEDNMDSEEIEFTIGTVSCDSLLTMKKDNQVVQKFGEVKLTAKAVSLATIFSKMFKKSEQTNEYLEYFLSNSAQKILQKIQKTDPEYYEELTVKYHITPEKIGCYAAAFYKKSNSSKDSKDFVEFLHKYFSGDIYIAPIEAYVSYLINRQSYGVNTVNAGAGMPVISRALGIYRHGYIQIYDSPFKNGKSKENKMHEVLELNPTGQTNELKAASVTGQIRVVPGIVTMALHLAGNERLKTGQYKLINYRPWVNDCQTYFKHTQERMNKILLEIDPECGHALQQEIINHYRYRPGMSKKDAEWLRRQAGLQLQPDKEIFETNLKGLAFITPPTKARGLKSTGKDFRNVLEDRSVGVSPSKNMLKYMGWVMKQFGHSSVDRVKKHLEYKSIELATKGKIHEAINFLSKLEDFLNEMVRLLAVDMMKSKLSGIFEMQYISCYKEVVGLQYVLLKNKEVLSDVLKKLDDAPFNAELNINVNHLREEIAQDIQNLRKGVVNIYNLLNKQNISCIEEKKNILDAIEDLKKNEIELDSKLIDVLMCGVDKSEESAKITPTLKTLSPEKTASSSVSIPSAVMLLSKTPTTPIANRQIVESKIKDFLNAVTCLYAHSMADLNERVWGGDIEIQLLGEMKDLKIYVHYANIPRKPDILGAHNAKKTIHLLYSNGNHYDVCDAAGVLTQKTNPDGNCLFEAIIRAENKLTKSFTRQSDLSAKIAVLRKQISEILLKNYHQIEAGTAFHHPAGFQGEAVKLLQRDDVVWVRFKAVFEAENNHQLQEALSLLPNGTLKKQAEMLKRELDSIINLESFQKIQSKNKP
jgi:hypothetical protein